MAQEQGEFHKHIVKKTDDERRKSKGKEWWGAGVVVFSSDEIPRAGTISEIEPILKNEFNEGETFYGRIFLPWSVGEIQDGQAPESFDYRMYVNGKLHYQAGVEGEYMPDPEWSSWYWILPEDLENGFNSLPSGKLNIRMEVWSSLEYKRETTYHDKDTGKAVFSETTNENAGKFCAAGDFIYNK
jgi:hypothetical protein